MKRVRSWSIVLLLALAPPGGLALADSPVAAPALSALSAPVLVSPTVPEGLAMVDRPCPTFSWAGAAGAESWRLEIRSVESGVPPITKDLPAGARSWTPSREDCLRPGVRYGWTVRAVEGSALGPAPPPQDVLAPARTAAETALVRLVAALGSESSGAELEPHLLQIDSELGQRVRAILSRGVETATIQATMDSAVDDSGAISGSARAHAAVDGVVGRADADEGIGVRGLADHVGVGGAHGVLGRAAAPGGAAVVGRAVSASAAGVRAASLDPGGGPDLLLDGAAQGRVDASLEASGIDRASADCSPFSDACLWRFENSGGGGMTLTVDGVAVLTEGADENVLTELSCTAGQIAVYDATSESWTCSDPP